MLQTGQTAQRGRAWQGSEGQRNVLIVLSPCSGSLQWLGVQPWCSLLVGQEVFLQAEGNSHSANNPEILFHCHLPWRTGWVGRLGQDDSHAPTNGCVVLQWAK